VGECSLDTICVAPAFPAPNQKLVISRLELPGGQASTAAVACARLEWRAGFVGAIGDDPAGKTIADSLRRERVDAHLIVKKGIGTRTAVIIVDKATASRTVLEARDQRLNIGVKDTPADLVASARVVLVDGSDPALARRVITLASKAGARTMLDVDAVSTETLDLIGRVDVAIVPERFVTEAVGPRGLGGLARTTRARVLVATCGPDGAKAWSDGKEVHVSARKVDAVDSTGAGDAFRGGFAAAWLASEGSNPDLMYLLEVAVDVGALNCRAVGAQTALPTRSELREFGSSAV